MSHTMANMNGLTVQPLTQKTNYDNIRYNICKRERHDTKRPAQTALSPLYVDTYAETLQSERKRASGVEAEAKEYGW